MHNQHGPRATAGLRARAARRPGSFVQASVRVSPLSLLCLLLLAALLGACSGGSGGRDDTDPALRSVGGTISGLAGTVVLQNNGGDNLSRSANGAFSFSSRVASGGSYAVTVLSQPAGQNCQVTSGAGTVGSANVTNITVVCQDVTSDAANASLSALTLSNGALAPGFAANQTAYTSTQPFPVTSLQVTPVSAAPGATIRVNGTVVASGQASQAIALTAGTPTVVTVAVTAPNGTTTSAYTITVTRQAGSGFAQQAYIKASNPDGVSGNSAGAGDQFGYAVALSGDGNTLAVGATYESSNATGINGPQGNNLASESGAVYVFVRSGGTWVQQAYVKASNTDAGDSFGLSVALSDDGSVLAVGAFGEDSPASGVNGSQSGNTVANAGAVYVYTRSGGTWTQQAYLKQSHVPSGSAVEYFGWSVALSSDGATLAVGAPNEDSNATGVNGNQVNAQASASGAVYVFTRSGSTWSQQAYVKASNTQANDQFGAAVRISGDGNTLAVGAPGEDSNATSIDGDQTSNAALHAGAVYVFARAGGVWSQQAYVKASNANAGDEFGGVLALSGDGNTLAVGATYEDSASTGINGDQMSNAAADSGAVYVYSRTAATWSQQAYVKASNAAAEDRFGNSMALSGDGSTLVVGARDEDSIATGIDGDQSSNQARDSGAVYVFARAGGAWNQRSYVKASNAAAGDRFGMSVALSTDADTLAVGADGEDSNATGINGNQSDDSLISSGAAYVFTGLNPP